MGVGRIFYWKRPLVDLSKNISRAGKSCEIFFPTRKQENNLFCYDFQIRPHPIRRPWCRKLIAGLTVRFTIRVFVTLLRFSS